MRLTEAEWSVLNVLWEKGHVSLKELTTALAPTKHISFFIKIHG